MHSPNHSNLRFTQYWMWGQATTITTKELGTRIDCPDPWLIDVNPNWTRTNKVMNQLYKLSTNNHSQWSVVTDAKVSKQYVEHQSSVLWETSSPPSCQSQCRWEMMWRQQGWGQEVVGGKKWLMPSNVTFTSHLLCWFVNGKFPLFHSCFLPSPTSPSLFYLHLPQGWLGVSQ